MTCEDYISRQSVLDIDFDRICLTTAKPAEMIRNRIKDLSSVQPKTDIFDKIMAEMQFYSNSFVLAGRNDLASAVSYCIGIIDKYRQEG